MWHRSGPQGADYLALADEHLRTLELAAAMAVEDLGFERRGLNEELHEPGAVDVVTAAYAEVIAETMDLAERCATLRARLRQGPGKVRPREPIEAPAGLEKSSTPADSGPSEGVVLVANQLALHGVETRQIEAILTALGVEDAPKAVKHALG